MAKIHIELTPEQAEILKPLFDAVREKPSTGAIIGQLWEPEYTEWFGFENPVAVFDFVTPDELREIVNKSEAEKIRRVVLSEQEAQS